jgi:hypothetical protein
MKRVILSGVVVFLILAGLAACGGKSSSTTTSITATVSPTAASVTTGLTQQFTVTIANTTNTAVTWSVNGITGGSQAIGFISSTGLYTAPSNVPTPATVTVTATSQADTSVTGSASVTITAPATPAAPLTVSPQTATVLAGGIQTFAATVSGNPIAVNWTLNCQSSGDACGTISTTGVYTAPASVPPGGNVSVTAAAKDNSVPAAGAVVTVQFSNGTLNGKYAFTFFGQNAGASYVAAGSVSFDGNGKITGGTEDVNSGGGSAVTINSGTYHIGTDGRGNATFVTSPASVTVNWQFVVVNHSRGFVIRFDSGVPSASGTIELQDASQFTLAGVNGSYALNLSGANLSGRPGSLATAGALTSNGAGVISGGSLDVNNAGSPLTGLSLAGTYVAPNGSGRGTMTLNSAFGTQNLVYYIVDATHVKLIETDLGAQLAGDAYKQPAGPFTNASIGGGFAFAFLGSTSSGAFGEGGVLTLSAGTVTSGTMDINKNGNPQNSLAVSGTYNVADATTGRTTATLSVGGSTLLYALYPQINGALSVVEIDTSNVVAGRALAQAIGAFSGGSFQGNYALNFTGTDFVVNPGEEDMVGQMVPNGGSAITGSVDISDNGFLTHSASLSASYSVASSGHGSMFALTTTPSAFSNATFNMYIADAGDALFLESDGTRVLVGIAQRQY